MSAFLRGEKCDARIIKVVRDEIRDWKVIEDFISSMCFKESINEFYQFWPFLFPERVVRLILGMWLFLFNVNWGAHPYPLSVSWVLRLYLYLGICPQTYIQEVLKK